MRTAAMASKASPSRKMCAPSAKGPTCSTSTCSSRSRDLSKPCSRQAAENAQVLQNWNSSPSSAAAGEVRRPEMSASLMFRAGSNRYREMREVPGSDDAGMSRALGGRWRLQIAVEAHGDHTQQQPAARGGGDAL